MDRGDAQLLVPERLDGTDRQVSAHQSADRGNSVPRRRRGCTSRNRACHDASAFARPTDRPTDRSYASWSSSPHLTASYHRPAQRSCTCSKTARATAAAPRSRSRHCNRNQHATDSAGTHRKAPEIVPDNQPAGERPKRAHTRALLVIERPQSRAACRSAASIDERHASSGASRGARNTRRRRPVA